ncbi:hypothetical protein ACFFON_06355 [Arthrobacter citreus]|uniref:protein kinase domain-containing protein n=1 Tax=Arthrobacter TaxID=1663 RepID=UPI00126466C8|nr:hypothetical protein [Arthrobacter gandavensis]
MTARRENARRLSAVLAGLDDAGVLTLINAAETVGMGIGGTTSTVLVDGTTVFLKQLPLTSAEEQDPTSTAGRAQLPFACHYGIGSPSHGAGRELAAHQLASDWVQTGKADFFPLLLGWRVVDRPCALDLHEFDGDGPPRQWGSHWPQVQNQVTAMEDATSSLVLFLEYVPETLGARVRRSLADGLGEEVFVDAVHQILQATDWMRTEGFQHFDVHPGNILVREGTLLFTDFGLALHRGWKLTAVEAEAMPAHEDYDRETALMHLFHWVLYELGFTTGPQRLALLRAAAADPGTPALASVRAALGDGADLIACHAAAAVYSTEMFATLMRDASTTQYTGTQGRQRSVSSSW